MSRVLLLIVSNILVIITSILPAIPAGAVMSSNNYQIWADSVSSGGNRSTSTNFTAEDIIGEIASGEDATSANFLLDAGLPAIFAEPVLLMTVSSSSATLSPSPIPIDGVSVASYTITVSTNALAGFTLSAVEDGNFRSGSDSLPDVSDGSVTQGNPEYGIAVSGTNAAFSDDRALSGSALVVGSSTAFVNNSVHTVTHRAARSASTATGDYAHTVTYTIVGNF